MNQKWDGRFRLVTYDIPSDEANSRQRVRQILKNLGFKLLQQSVWISPFQVKAELEEFLEKADLSEYVWVLEISLPLSKGRDLIKRLWGKIDSKLPTEITQKEAFEKNSGVFLNRLLANQFLPPELI